MSTSGNDKSISQLADQLVVTVAEMMLSAKNEEELRIEFEKIIAPICKSLGIELYPRYDRQSEGVSTVYRGKKSDAVHGMVIIEYEPPHAFDRQSAVEHAHNQHYGQPSLQICNYLWVMELKKQ